MKIIKVSGLHKTILHQTMMNKGIYDGCKFILDEPEMIECDCWFIFDPNCLKEDNKCFCDKNNVYFIMGEPDNIRVYNNKFIEQFDNIIGVQDKLYNVSNCFRNYWAMWFVGLEFKNDKQTLNHKYDLEKLLEMNPPKKSKLISVVTSNKRLCDGHINRLKFVDKLKEHFGDKIDVFGRGINDFVDKADVLMPYKYHIAIENTSQNDYITEKLLDPFITYTFPIYYGANNAHEYFAYKSFKQIDINEPQNAIQTIEEIIAQNAYEKRLNYIKESRYKVLHEYNIFSKMAEIAKNQNTLNAKDVISLKAEYDFDYKQKIKRIIKNFLTC